MEAYQMLECKPTFPLGEAGKFLYEYNKKKSENFIYDVLFNTI